MKPTRLAILLPLALAACGSPEPTPAPKAVAKIMQALVWIFRLVILFAIVWFAVKNGDPVTLRIFSTDELIGCIR